MTHRLALATTILTSLLCQACSSTGSGSQAAAGGAGGAAGAAGAAGGDRQGGTGGGNLGGGGAPVATGNDDNATCAVAAIVRDFTDEHPDFERPVHPACFDKAAPVDDAGAPLPDAGPPLGGCPARMVRGITAERLDEDRLPILADEGPYVDPATFEQIAGAESFRQWWTDVEGVNTRVDVRLPIEKVSPSLRQIGNNVAFFPIDDRGFGNIDRRARPEAGDMSSDTAHNQLFTMVLRMKVRYRGEANERITLGSDDDGWVFLDGRLLIDNGGSHPLEINSVTLGDVAEAFDLRLDGVYDLDVFFADRRLSGAKFQLLTNMEIITCEDPK